MNLMRNLFCWWLGTLFNETIAFRRFFEAVRGEGRSRVGLAGAAIVLVLSGCGAFESPYEIRLPPPAADSLAAEFLPVAEGMFEAETVPVPEHLLEAAYDHAFRQYPNEVLFGVIRFDSSESAAEALEQIHEEFEFEERLGGSSASRKTRVSHGDYSWSQAIGVGTRYQFAWTNHEWLFIVQSPSRSQAEPVLLECAFLAEKDRG